MHSSRTETKCPTATAGYPFLGSPILLAIFFAVAQAWKLPVPGTLNTMRVGLCLALAVLAGWRLAYHLHMRAADEYGGAYVHPMSVPRF